MSVAPASAALALLLQPDVSLAARLTVGQVVRAQVLQHYEGSRYQVRILGQQAVLDSPAALRPNEVIWGRVTSLDDRVQLERVEQPAAEPAADAAEQAIPGLGAGPAAELIDDLFRRYRATLDARDAKALERLVARSPQPSRMALAALVLRKLELPLEERLLGPLCEALARPAELAPLAETILNAQAGGSVSHQLGRLLSGEEFALFEEDDGGETRHRKLVLEIPTGRLGLVEARAVAAGDRVRVALATASSEATNALLRHGESLARALAEAGWQVDEISHETRPVPETGAAIAAAVGHLITPGSLSRLL